MTDEKSLAPVSEEHRLALLGKFMGLSEEESRNLVAILTQGAPKDWVLERPIRGGGVAKYVPGFRFIQRFNDAFGFLWSYEVPNTFEKDGHVVAQGRWSLQVPGRTITRKHPDGTEETFHFEGFSIIKEQFGSAQVKKWATERKDKSGAIVAKKGDSMDLGNDYKAAATDAMKKCGTELGMFLDIYGQRETSEEAGPAEAQVQAFYQRAEVVGMDKERAEEWATEKTGKKFSELSRQEVLGLVADLIDMKKRG